MPKQKDVKKGKEPKKKTLKGELVKSGKKPKAKKDILVSLEEISKVISYPAYELFCLAEDKAFKTSKRRGAYYARLEDVNKYFENPKTENGFVSLSDIANEAWVPYSAEYLSLRVRQGKLRGEKRGRNWCTRREWVREYLQTLSAKPNADILASESKKEFGSKTRNKKSKKFFGKKAFNLTPTKIFTAGLCATLLLVVAPPTAWAEWTGYVSKVFKIASAELSNRANILSDKVLGVGGKVEKISNKIVGVRQVAEEHATKQIVKFSSSIELGEQEDYLAFGESQERKEEHGFVLGDSTIFEDTKSLLSDLRESFKMPSIDFSPVVSFLDPTSKTSIMARLSGKAIDVCSSVAGLNLFDRSRSRVTNLSLKMDFTRVLQPAGEYIIRIGDSALRFGSEYFSDDETIISGQMALQDAVHVFANEGRGDSVVLRIISHGSAPMIQAINSSGDIVFSLSDSGDLNVRNLTASHISTGSLDVGAGALQASNRQVVVNTSLSVGSDLVVRGATNLEGLLNVGGALTVGGAVDLKDTLTVAKIVHAISGIMSDALIDTKSLRVREDSVFEGPINAYSNLTVWQNLNVIGSSVFSGSVTVGGDLLVQGNLSAGRFSPDSIHTGQITASSLTASGPVLARSVTAEMGSFGQLSARDATIGSDAGDNLRVFSTSTFSAPVSIQSTLDVSSALSVGGAANLASTLNVSGNTTLSTAQIENLTVTGS
jgi:hypothetical protein